MATDRRRRRRDCRVCFFTFISAHPRYPWLKIFRFSVPVLVLVSVEDLTAPCGFSGFQFGLAIVAQTLPSSSRLVVRDRRLEAAAMVSSELRKLSDE